MLLDEIDRKVIGALHVDGRAPWRRIAAAIGVPFSTVTRRGNALLERGAVRIVVMRRIDETAIVEIECEPRSLSGVVDELAAREDTIFVFVLADPVRVLVEFAVGTDDARDLVLDTLLPMDGVRDLRVVPIVTYDRTIADWRPDLLNDEERAALGPGASGSVTVDAVETDDIDERLVEGLARGPRATAAELATTVELSEMAVRRRLDRLIGSVCEVRAVVAPALVGFRVAAFVWLRVHGAHLDKTVAALLESSRVRYVARPLGAEQLVFDVVAPSVAELGDFLRDAPWQAYVESMRVSTVLAARKRGRTVVAES